MRFKTNIPALLLATLVFIATNGIVLSEHICNTARSHDYSFFTEAKCEMEKQAISCCAKKIIAKNNCCEHKHFLKKMHVEGFTANQVELKIFEKLVLHDFILNNSLFHHQINFDRYITGIPPPDNLYTIKYQLRPTTVVLQIFRC